jgi:CheY-like chemotaxis protein
MRRMTKFFLRDLPFEFEECADGADALDCYEKTNPDWILMDWKMKRMDGLTATRQIIAANPKAHVMMVSDYQEVELRNAAFEAGACQYVVKEDLLSILEIPAN